jgi:hypothetical protein
LASPEITLEVNVPSKVVEVTGTGTPPPRSVPPTTGASAAAKTVVPAGRRTARARDVDAITMHAERATSTPGVAKPRRRRSIDVGVLSEVVLISDNPKKAAEKN